MLKIGVILSGCGYMDGSEIHETVCALLAIEKLGAQAVCLAPDKDQADVVDHLSGQAAPEKRGVLRESARLARGAVRPLAQAKAEEFDALLLPGGFGAAKNLCTFARDGAACAADPDAARLLEAVHAAGKPIGAACIAPVLLARLFGQQHPELTIGDDPATARALEAMGGRHKTAGASEVVVDARLRLATTPAYMKAGSVLEVARSLEALTAAVLELAGARSSPPSRR